MRTEGGVGACEWIALRWKNKHINKFHWKPLMKDGAMSFLFRESKGSVKTKMVLMPFWSSKLS